jgi:hypothetical protein
MDCKVNEVNFELNGEGIACPATGLNDMQFSAAGAPEGFDPVSCPMICNVQLTSYVAQPLSDSISLRGQVGSKFSVSPARIGRVHDADGRELLNLQVESELEQRGNQIIVTSRMLGVSRLPKLSHNVAPIKDYIIPVGPGEATGVVRFQLVTETGDTLNGSTLIPYRWKGEALENILCRQIDRIDVKWNGFSDIHAVVQSRWVRAVALERLIQAA